MITVNHNTPRTDWHPQVTARRSRQPLVGRRVQVPAYTDEWMQGDRWGVVTLVHPPAAYFLAPWATIRLDRSGRERRFIVGDCKVVTL